MTGRLSQQGSISFIVQIVSNCQIILQIPAGQDTNKGSISKPQYPLLEIKERMGRIRKLDFIKLEIKNLTFYRSTKNLTK